MKNARSIKVFKDCLGIGIDVSKAELVIVGLSNGEPYILRVNNKMKAVRCFLQRLHKTGYCGKIICESTGHYHLKLLLACHEFGLSIILLNPLQSSKHTKSKIRKTKTDAEDGLTLATMCVTEPKLPPPVELTVPKALIRLKMGHSGMLLAGIHSLYYCWILAFAGMTEEKLRCLYHRISLTDQVLTFVLTTSLFVLSSTGSLVRERARTV